MTRRRWLALFRSGERSCLRYHGMDQCSSNVVDAPLRQLSIYRSFCAPILNYGHELWVTTERLRSQFPRRGGGGAPFRDRARSSVAREELSVEPLLLRIETGQARRRLWTSPWQRCSGHVLLGRGPEEDPGDTGGTVSLGWASGGVREPLLRLLPPRLRPG